MNPETNKIRIHMTGLRRMLGVTLTAAMLLVAGGCASDVGIMVTQAERDAVRDMQRDLEDAQAKVDRYCGSGTAEAAAAGQASEELSNALAHYQEAAAQVNAARTRNNKLSEERQPLLDKIQDTERDIQVAQRSTEQYMAGERGGFIHLWDNWSQIVYWCETHKRLCHELAAKASAQVQQLKNSPGATPEMIAQAEEIAQQQAFDDEHVDTWFNRIFEASRDGDEDLMKTEFLRLAALKEKMTAQSKQLERLQLQADLAHMTAQQGDLPGEVERAQKNYDLRKQMMNQQLSESTDALAAARAKAVECAGTDVFEDGSPMFPPMPADWNSTFWDISSP